MSDQLTRLYKLSTGDSYGVFIDDTGSSGIGTPWLHKNRKTYVGVVIPPEQMQEVLEQMPGAIEELQKLTGEEEFHFSELINQN